MIKRAILLMLILNSIILIGIPSGHGYGIMAMIEYIGIRDMIFNGFEFNKVDLYESSLFLIALISLIGKLIVIVLLFLKDILNKIKWLYTGLILMLISFIFVSYGTWNYDNILFAISLGSAIPFLIYFGSVLYLTNKEKDKKQNKIKSFG